MDRKFHASTVWAVIPLDCICEVENYKTKDLRRPEAPNMKYAQEMLDREIRKHTDRCILGIYSSKVISIVANDTQGPIRFMSQVNPNYVRVPKGDL